LINLDEPTNTVINVVKAKYGLKDKGQAIQFIVNKYIEDEKEPELKPEFVEKIRAMESQKSIPMIDFGKRYGLR
jgi:hypothetical protein